MEGVLMRATQGWMSANYSRFNQELFGGQLSDCICEVFTNGRGSQGRTLGKFMLKNEFVFVDPRNNSMYVISSGSHRIYINWSNFFELCRPCIMLNGNYSGTEDALQSTLVHEMCHYYTYMFGNCPKQAHGKEFRYIASLVSSRSGGKFSIHRLASAEEMSNYKLSDEMQAKNDRRIANRKAKALAIIVYKKNGKVELTITSIDNRLVPKIIFEHYSVKRCDVKEIITSTDPRLIGMLYDRGYRKLMRTYRYWDISNAPWVNSIKSYDYEYMLQPDYMNENQLLCHSVMIDKIVESVIDDYVSGIDVGAIKIGGIDLELRSPLEGID